MKRREFCGILGLGAGAAALPLRVAAGSPQEVASNGVVPNFPVADWQTVVDEGWGTGGAAAGPGTWDGVSLTNGRETFNQTLRFRLRSENPFHNLTVLRTDDTSVDIDWIRHEK